jgi:toxin ParE1/3/4
MIIRSGAERDVAAAIASYDAIARGLGAMFLMRTDAAIAAIQRSPAGFRKSHGAYRHLVLRRFPYGVFYLFDGQTIVIVAVLNLRQDPTALRGALV